MESAGAQTEMPQAKISIKEETKCQGSSTKTTWIYVQRKGKAEWQKEPQTGGIRSPGFLAQFCQTLYGVRASSFFFLGLGSPSTSFGLH